MCSILPCRVPAVWFWQPPPQQQPQKQYAWHFLVCLAKKVPSFRLSERHGVIDNLQLVEERVDLTNRNMPQWPNVSERSFDCKALLVRLGKTVVICRNSSIWFMILIASPTWGSISTKHQPVRLIMLWNHPDILGARVLHEPYHSWNIRR